MQNCVNFLSETLDEYSASTGRVSAQKTEVVLATPAVGGSNSEIGVIL